MTVIRRKRCWRIWEQKRAEENCELWREEEGPCLLSWVSQAGRLVSGPWDGEGGRRWPWWEGLSAWLLRDAKQSKEWQEVIAHSVYAKCRFLKVFDRRGLALENMTTSDWKVLWNFRAGNWKRNPRTKPAKNEDVSSPRSHGLFSSFPTTLHSLLSLFPPYFPSHPLPSPLTRGKLSGQPIAAK